MEHAAGDHGVAAAAVTPRERGAVGDVRAHGYVERARRRAAVDRDDRRAVRSLPLERERAGSVVREQDAEVSVRQGRHVLPQRRERAVVVGQRRVRGAARVGPRIRAPVVRIVGAGHADLVAVVDRRRARYGELEQRRELQPRLARSDVGRVALLRRRRRRPGREHPEQPRGVVAVEQVHQRVAGRARVVLPDRCEAGGRLRRRDLVSAVAEALGVERPRREEPEHRVTQAIVHRRVGAVAAQVAQQRRILLPQLADDHVFGLNDLTSLAELLPVAVGERRVAHHVEAPAGRTVAGLPSPASSHSAMLFWRG